MFPAQSKTFVKPWQGISLRSILFVSEQVSNAEIFNIDNGITYCNNYHLKSGLHKNEVV